jgi:CHASE2 domain-containing sensor protein
MADQEPRVPPGSALEGSASLPRRGIGRRFREAAPVFILLLLFTLLFSTSKLSEVLDSTMDLTVPFREPLLRSDIAVVRIAQSDFEHSFGAKRPLDPDTVGALLATLARFQPRAIGVDLITYDTVWRRLRPPQGVPVYWAQSAHPCSSREPPGMRCTREQLVTEPVLGGRGAGGSEALVTFTEDDDGVVRRYRRWIETTEGLRPTLPAVIAGKATHGTASNTGEYLVDFRTKVRRRNFRMAEVMGQDSFPLLKGKIVLVGGTFVESGDFYETPIGTLSGVDILAHITETEIRGEAVRVPERWLVLVVALVVGLVIVALFVLVNSPLRAGIISAVSIPIIAAAASYLISGSLALTGYFIPLLLIVLVEELYHELKSHRDHIFRETVKA